jgi:hypothetical protein
MKKHILASALVVFIGGSLAAACDNGGFGTGYFPAGGTSAFHGDHRCGEQTSCGSCTPIEGCGWCQTGVGQGMCAADPNECAGSTAFSWTWDPSGCFPTTDAAAASDASVADASTVIPLSDDAGSDDGGSLEDASPVAH